MDTKFRVGLVQMACAPDPARNLESALAWVEKAGAAGAQIVCLPELFRNQYFCQREDPALFDLAESIPGPTTEEMSAIAKNRRVAVIVPIFERRAPGVYHNSAAVVD